MLTIPTRPKISAEGGRSARRSGFYAQQPLDQHFTGPTRSSESAFYCVLALTLCSLLRRELSTKGIDFSVNRMLDTFATIREIQVLVSLGCDHPRTKWIRSQLEPLAEEVFDTLGLGSHFA